MGQPAKLHRSAVRVTVLFTATIAAAYGFGVYLFASLTPDMRESLGLSYAAIGTIGAARQAAFFVAALATPIAVLHLGGGRVILGSMLVCSAAFCGLAISHSAAVAAVLLVVLNACAASAWVPMVALVTQAVAFDHQGKAVGLIASGTNYGLCTNGILVPVLLPAFGWRSVWIAVGGLTALICVVIWWTLRGVALLGTASEVPRAGRIPWHLVTAPRYGVTYVLAGLGGLGGVPFATYVSARIRDDLHLSIGVSGMAWLAMGLMGAVGGVLIGALGDRFGTRVALAVAATILGASGLLAAIATSPAAMVIAAGGFGASFFSIFGLLPAYVGKTAEPELTPAICALVECALGLGGVAGSALGGFSPQVTGSFQPVFIGTAVLSLAMLALTQVLPSELVRLAPFADRSR